MLRHTIITMFSFFSSSRTELAQIFMLIFRHTDEHEA